MSAAPRPQGYNGVSRFNHWLVAIVVIGMIALGLYADWVPRDERGFWMRLHIGIGTLAVLFVMFRIAWRMARGFPAPYSEHAMVNRLARVAHWLLMLAVLIMVVSGPLAVFSGGRDINVFGWFSIPTFMERNEDLHHLIEDIHVITSKVLIGLISAHILGAIWHGLVSKDGTIGGMLRGNPDGR